VARCFVRGRVRRLATVGWIHAGGFLRDSHGCWQQDLPAQDGEIGFEGRALFERCAGDVKRCGSRERGGMWAAKVHRLEQLFMMHQHSHHAAKPWGRVIAANVLAERGESRSSHVCLVLRRVDWSLDMLPGISKHT